MRTGGCIPIMINLSFEEKWEKIIACDQTYDGLFYTAVKTTKIYCRPSCRSRKPKKQNVEFYLDKEKVEEDGFRACKRCKPEVDLSPNTQFALSVITFLINHSNEKILLQDIANHIGVSPYYLDRLFKQETSETPRMYLEKVRVDKAAHLLRHTTKSNLEVCYEVGFQSTSNFYKVFFRLKDCGVLEIIGTEEAISSIMFAEQDIVVHSLTEVTPAVLKDCYVQMDEYFKGKRREFSFPYTSIGTDFQKSVWNALTTVPYGETGTYKDIAIAIGNEKAIRAVGSANGKNKLSIVIPCHRIIGTNGKLTGYAGGLWRKEWLLEHEKGINRFRI